MRRAFFAACLTGVIASAGCRAPTSITLTVTSELACSELHGVAIAVGGETSSPVTTTTQCTPDARGGSRIGTLVIVPGGSNEVSVRVVAGVDRPVEECANNAHAGCIVARRVMRFSPHEELSMAIELRRDCKGVACDASTTCVAKVCRPSNAPDDAEIDASVDAPVVDSGTPDGPPSDGGCSPEQKNCDGKCVAIADPAYGCSSASCSPCAASGDSSFTCDSGACKPTGCKTGFKSCDGSCVPTDVAHGCTGAACIPCPADNGTASCDGATCKIACNTGYKLCGGKCVNIGDPSFGCTATGCDNSACPKSGTVVCSGGACILGSCGPGTKACSGSCVPTDTTKGCGDVARCTPCAAGESCVGGPPTTCQCVPEAKSTTCAKVQCGVTKNNCGQNVDCGSAACAAPQTCGGGGSANTCGCTAPSPCDGVSCGVVNDSCGVAQTCGCTGVNTCGGGGTPGKCGCTAVNPCVGGNCGTLSNGCGGTVTCGCTVPQTCGGGGTAGKCGCTPEPTTVTCEFRVCGSVLNNCGTSVSCGSCTGTKPKCCIEYCACSTCTCAL